MPQVSVIIVNYNAGKLLLKAVRSVLRFHNVEVVVADNASKDGSFLKLQETIKSDRLILIDNGANLGFGKAVNSAVEHSHGEYVFLLNPDAELTQSALSQMLLTAHKWGNRCIVAPSLLNSDQTPQASCYRPQTIFNALKEYWLGIKGAYSKYLPSGRKAQVVHAAVAAAWLIHRSVWEELGGLSDKYFLYFEDLDMCDRASRAGISVIYDPAAKVMHAHGVSSRTNPIVLKLFTDSAREYHGWFKKIMIDLIIHARDLFISPVSPKKIAGIIIAYALFVLSVASLGYFLLPMRYAPSSLIPSFYHSNFLLWSWANFDGEHYLRIAQLGYQTVLGQSEYAFFPLFPLLINLLARTGLDAYQAAHLLIFTFSVGFMVILVKWASRFTANPLALLWTILLSPGAIYLAAIYTEPLFLFLVVLTFYFSEQKSWGRAILTSVLATATRVNGIFLVLYLFLRMGKNRALSVLGLTGIGAYMLYLYLTTGNALAWYSAQSGWQKASPTAPWVTLTNYLRTITIDFAPDLTHLVVMIEIIVTSILVYLLVRFWRKSKLHLAYKYYALANLALPLATGSLGSMPRFSLTLFPLFLMIPHLPRTFRLFTYFFFLITAMLGIVLFTRGYWYA